MSDVKEAIVLVGGLGTRLRSVVKDVPKPMADINGKPFLEYLLAYLKAQGIEHVIFSAGYKHEILSDHFGDSHKDMKISYAIEDKRLDTGGAIQYACDKVQGDYTWVFNGDTYFDQDLSQAAAFFAAQKADWLITARYIDDATRYGRLQFDEKGRVNAFEEKSDDKAPGYINSGAYLFAKNLFRKHSMPEVFSIERDFFKPKLQDLSLYAFPSEGFFIDIGIPSDYQYAHEAFRSFKY